MLIEVKKLLYCFFQILYYYSNYNDLIQNYTGYIENLGILILAFQHNSILIYCTKQFLILYMYHNKQYFIISNFLFTRIHFMFSILQTLRNVQNSLDYSINITLHVYSHWLLQCSDITLFNMTPLYLYFRSCNCIHCDLVSHGVPAQSSHSLYGKMAKVYTTRADGCSSKSLTR